MTCRQESYYIGIGFCLLLVTRFLSECVNTFIWDKANQFWSILTLATIFLALWPYLMIISRGRIHLLWTYSPVMVYLIYLSSRTSFVDMYSLKCFLSELIIWFFFVFTIEVLSMDSLGQEIVRRCVLWIIKIIVIVGVVQLTIFLVTDGSVISILSEKIRPLKGIFVYSSVYIVTILPFIYVFIKQRSWLWGFLTLATSLATGTRGPFLAFACILFLTFKSAFRWQIRWRHVAFTILLIILSYSILIEMNSHGAEYPGADSRLTFQTLKWRVDFWKNFLRADSVTFWVGNGVGAADDLATSLNTDMVRYQPHNDYLRVFYDSGILGLFLFINLIFFMLRLLMRSTNSENDFIVIIYLLVISDCITDNFIYYTHSLWLFVFLATFVSRPAMTNVQQ